MNDQRLRKSTLLVALTAAIHLSALGKAEVRYEVYDDSAPDHLIRGRLEEALCKVRVRGFRTMELLVKENKHKEKYRKLLKALDFTAGDRARNKNRVRMEKFISQEKIQEAYNYSSEEIMQAYFPNLNSGDKANGIVKKGLYSAIGKLGEVFEKRNASKEDLEEIVHAIEKASAYGNLGAIHIYAYLVRYGLLGLQKNVPKAMLFYKCSHSSCESLIGIPLKTSKYAKYLGKNASQEEKSERLHVFRRAAFADETAENHFRKHAHRYYGGKKVKKYLKIAKSGTDTLIGAFGSLVPK